MSCSRVLQSLEEVVPRLALGVVLFHKLGPGLVPRLPVGLERGQDRLLGASRPRRGQLDRDVALADVLHEQGVGDPRVALVAGLGFDPARRRGLVERHEVGARLTGTGHGQDEARHGDAVARAHGRFGSPPPDRAEVTYEPCGGQARGPGTHVRSLAGGRAPGLTYAVKAQSRASRLGAL